MGSEEVLDKATAGIFQSRGGVDTAIGHWSQLLPGLRESTQDFYAAIESALGARQIPDCRVSRVDWREGGVVSAKREYLRAERGEHVIDICGAGFGNAFFASSWLCVPPPNLLNPLMIVVVGLALAGYLVTKLSLVVILFLVLDLLFVLAIAVFGILRPLYFPPRLTYYRVDTAEMFYRAVSEVVGEVVNSLCSAQGVRGLSEEECKPIMRGFRT